MTFGGVGVDIVTGDLTTAAWHNALNKLNYTIFGNPATVAEAAAAVAPAVDKCLAYSKVMGQGYIASLIGTFIPFDNTAPQVSEGVSILSIAYTPTLFGSRLIVKCDVTLSAETGTHMTAAIFETDSGGLGAYNPSAIAVSSGYCAGNMIRFKFSTTLTAGNSHAFSVRVGPSASTVTFGVNGRATQTLGNMISSTLEIFEISA